QERYWMQEYTDPPVRLAFPLDYPRTAVQGFEGAAVESRLDETLTAQLKKQAQKNETTIFMLLLAAYTIQLSRYSGQEEIVVGTPATGRKNSDLEQIVGMFSNTLALRNRPQQNNTFQRYLKEVKEKSLKAFENQDYQFEMLVEKLGLPREGLRNPMFDVMFNFQNEATFNAVERRTQNQPEFTTTTTHFDISLQGAETGNQLTFALNYRTGLFKKETMERFLKHYENILKGIVNNPGSRLAEIEMLSWEEKNELLAASTFTGNDEEGDYDFD
ncbi:MAG: non-ribosomal peptide synthetase, partial [bacterium]|nr:non-ribosomal peptide synthetase [bacterium]